MPKQENIIKNFVNIELFHKKDLKKEDCIGWITIMEKADENLRTVLKKEKTVIEKRKKIAKGILNGIIYLQKIGITHLDVKLENILLINPITPTCPEYPLTLSVQKKAIFLPVEINL